MDSTEYLTQHINVAATDTNRPKEGMWDLVLQSSKQNPAALSAISQFFAPPEQDNNSGELPAEHEVRSKAFPSDTTLTMEFSRR
ncbi:hypothetical protein FRC03_002086 [Tulasnella sp. 419]|nr:hypothetical protein FRC03_002086 [Tulasnella sp. 419]